MQVAMTIKDQSLVLNSEELHSILDAIKYASRNDQDKGPQQFGCVHVESVRFGMPGAITLNDQASGRPVFSNGRWFETTREGLVLTDC